jgi:hypothetical protein
VDRIALARTVLITVFFIVFPLVIDVNVTGRLSIFNSAIFVILSNII